MFSFYIMVIGFLLASLVVAQKMGATGATASIAVGQRLRKGAQGILYRTFVGRAAKGGMNFIDKTGMSNWVGGRTLRGGLNKAYKYGAGGTGLAQTRSDIESHKAEVTKNRSRMTSAASVATANADIEAGLSSAPRLKKLRDKIKAGSTLTTSEQTEKDNLERIEAKMRTAATGLSKTEIENMSSKKRNEISHLFTAQQAKEFAKSDKVGTNDINSFTAARKNAIVAKITIPASTAGGTPTLDVTAVSKLTEAQLATLGGDWLMENAHLLTPSQFDEIRKTGKDNSVFTEEQAESFSDKRKNVINNIVANLNIPENNRIFSQYLEAIKTKHKEIASLPIDALLNPITAGYMNSKVLKEIDTKSDIRRTDKIRIAANIRGIPAGVGAADDGKKYLNTPKVVADGEWA